MAEPTEPTDRTADLDGPPPGPAADPSLRLDFVHMDLDGDAILRDAREDLARGEEAIDTARRLLDQRGRLEEWVTADPRHGELLFTDPENAITQALPGFGELKLTAPGRELFKRLLREHPLHKVGPREITKADPAVAMALELLGKVAAEALSSQGRYGDLTADPEVFVTAVAAGGYSTDTINRVVEAIHRGAGLPYTFSVGRQTVQSELWDFVTTHPDAEPS
jgi:hypothetical protein